MAPASNEPLTDAQALERYRYMVRTAPPETIEQAHAEAFSRLTPEQRREVLVDLAKAAPPDERVAAQATSPDDPRAMGRLATRTEMRQPGFMERVLAPGLGMGLGGSLLGSFAMGFVGSMVANSFFSAMHGPLPIGNDLTDTSESAGLGQAAEDSTAEDIDAGDVDMDDMDLGGGDFDV
jgi:hypothetical protein